MPKPKRNINAVAEETLTQQVSLPASQRIAKIQKAEGNNLYSLELPDGETLIAELQAKFRSTIWVKRGSYVVVDTAALAARENKLGGEIVNVVRDEKAWRKMSYWPVTFVKKSSYGDDSDDDGPKMPPSDSEDEQQV